MEAKGFVKYCTIILVLVLALSSCKEETCEDLGTCPEKSVLERTDLTISGDITKNDFQQVPENVPSPDLITYGFYESPAARFDIVIHMETGELLNIRMYNDYDLDPWNKVDVDYAIYPTQDLEDKWKYVTANYLIGNESPSYSSNIGNQIPAGISIDVFRITYYDGIEIRGRIREMTLYKNTNPSKSIEINGTFVGAVTFPVN